MLFTNSSRICPATPFHYPFNLGLPSLLDLEGLSPPLFGNCFQPCQSFFQSTSWNVGPAGLQTLSTSSLTIGYTSLKLCLPIQQSRCPYPGITFRLYPSGPNISLKMLYVLSVASGVRTLLSEPEKSIIGISFRRRRLAGIVRSLNKGALSVTKPRWPICMRRWRQVMLTPPKKRLICLWVASFRLR
jgi:hypothetical protein